MKNLSPARDAERSVVQPTALPIFAYAHRGPVSGMIAEARSHNITMITRRTFSQSALAAGAATIAAAQAAVRINPYFNGVRIGAQSYSFRDRKLDAAIKGMKEVGIGTVEMWSGHVEPAGLKREDLRKWRVSVDLKEIFQT